MTTFRDFLRESANDKGAFKAVFVIGIPGAGKSYTVKKLSGVVSPRVVNTDRVAEYISSKTGTPITSQTWGSFEDRSLHLTKVSLTNYLNGVLPLFIDGTSNNISNLLHRIGILESLGYDVGVVYVKTSLETAIKRTQERAEKIGRFVDEDFIRSVYKKTEDNANFLRTKAAVFKQVDNDSMELDNDTMHKAFVGVQNFFASPISNPIGKRFMEQMKQDKDPYLVPNIISKEVLDKKIEGWYK